MIDDFMEFSFRTRGFDHPLELVNHIERLLKKVNQEETITSEEKLSLEQLGSIEMLTKVLPTFKLIDTLHLTEFQPKLLEYNQACHQGDLVLEQINAKLHLNSNYKSGDIIFTDYDKLLRFRRDKKNFDARLKTLVLGMPLHHAAVVVKREAKIAKGSVEIDRLSHVLLTYEKNDFEIRDKVVSSCYRLDPSTVLTKDEYVLRLLERMYGSEESLKAEVRNLYQGVQRDLHIDDQDRYKGAINKTSHRLLTGLTEIFSSLHTKKPNPEQLQQLHKEYFDPHSNFDQKRIICSEFAAKTMLAGLIEEENLIKEKLLTYLESEGEFEEAKKVKEMEIFALPIPPTEKLSKLSTVRFLELLVENHCIERIEPHPLVRELVKEEDLQIDPKEEVFEVPLISGFAHRIRKLGAEADPFAEDSEAEFKWCPDALAGDMKAKMMKGTFFTGILKRRQEIHDLKEKWREAILEEKLPYPNE